MSLNRSLNVNLIHEKLKEKKQQQLRELRAIQEEIKEGKLVPPPTSTSSFSTDPPPNTKQHNNPNSASSPNITNNQTNCNNQANSNWPPVKMHCTIPLSPTSPYNYHHPPKKAPNRNLNNIELLLAPRCLPYYSHGRSASQTTDR